MTHSSYSLYSRDHQPAELVGTDSHATASRAEEAADVIASWMTAAESSQAKQPFFRSSTEFSRYSLH
jgi:hypothetical protein